MHVCARPSSSCVIAHPICKFGYSVLIGGSMSSRRGFLQNFLAGAGMFASAKVISAQEMNMSHGMQGMKMKKRGTETSENGHGIPPLVQTPDIANLSFRMDGNVKEFHLIAEPV